MEIYMRQEVYNKVMHWVNKADFEVSGFGKVVRHADYLEVTDVYLLKQEGGAAHTEIDSAALAKLMYETREVEGDLRFWWHSHVKMDVFWSGTDTATIRELAANGWILATVFNQNHESRTALGYTAQSAFGDKVSVDDNLTLHVYSDTNPEWDVEFDVNVKKKQYATYAERSLLDPDPAWHGYRFNDMGYDPGLLGYGTAKEAAALGMSEAAYVAVLDSRDQKAIYKLEDKLLYLDGKNKL